MAEAVHALGSLLRRGRSELDAAGLDDAAREATRLWAGLFDRSPASAVLERDRVLAPDDAARLAAAFARRAAGEPLAYVTGRAGFRLLELAVDQRVLIPRPETEGLVERLLSRAGVGTAVDVGTGSGCIALSLALEGRFSRVLAIDLSTAALTVARDNARRTGCAVSFVGGDLASALADDSVDALVSNPPYLSVAEYAALDPAVRDWEPATALVSGEDGLAATTALLQDARRVVKPGGWIALELDCNRAAAVAGRASALGWRDIVVEADLFERARYLLARRSMES